MVRRQADQVALPRDGDLQRLPNPPSRVSCEPSAVADIEAVDGLHQPADRLLQEIGIAESVVAETLGDVGGQAYISRRQTMLTVDVAVVDSADVDLQSGVGIAIVANELSHRPRLERGPMGPELREIADERFDQFALAFPEGGKQLALFFGSQEVGGKDRRRGVNGNGDLGRRLALATLGLHGRPSH